MKVKNNAANRFSRNFPVLQDIGGTWTISEQNYTYIYISNKLIKNLKIDKWKSNISDI